MPLSTRQELVAEGKAASQLLGTQLRPVYPQKSLEAQAQSSELYRAVAEGQDLFQMLGPTKGLQRGEMRAVETVFNTVAPCIAFKTFDQ